jgi:hypothetical protein
MELAMIWKGRCSLEYEEEDVGTVTIAPNSITANYIHTELQCVVGHTAV